MRLLYAGFGMSPRACIASLLLLATVGSLTVGSAAAQSLPVARLFSIFPVGGKQGTTFDVTIAGADLEKVSQLQFSDPGLSAVAKTQPPGLGQTGPQPVPGVFTVTIAPDARPGLCDVRAVGKYGISNPRSFVIGTRPELVEAEPNNTADKAMELPLGSTVNGQSNGATDQDYYKFTAQRGQRVIIDCWAYRIDSRMDATLVLYDATGKELDRNRDTNRRDPLIDFVVPADGVYFVEVNDFLYAGNNEHFYRLSIGTDPYLDFVFPPAGIPGSNSTYTLYGRNLPGGQPTKLTSADGKPLESLSVQIPLPADQSAQNVELASVVEPDESSIDGLAYRLTAPQGPSNSVLIGFAAAPVVLEQEPNDEPAKAQPLTLPCELAGQFFPQTDRDWFTFEAKASEPLWIEVLSQRLGLPTDPVLIVQQITKNEKGEEQVKEVAAVDDFLENPAGPGPRGMSIFDMKTDDPAFRFVPPADGTYRILVRNLANYTRPDPRFVYRLAIHPAQPDFRVVVKPRLLPFSPDPNQNPPTVWNALLRKGGTELFDVLVFRRDGFAGEVQVTVEGLPPGVTAAPVTVGPDQNAGVLVLAAAENAAEATALLNIVGKAKVGDAEIVRAGRSASMVWGGLLGQVTPRARLTRNLAVAVSGGETASFFVDAGPGTPLEMSKGGKIELPVKITRRGDFKGAVVLAPSPLPPNVKPVTITLEPAAAEGKLEIPLPANVPPGTYSFSILGATKVPYVRDPEAVKETTDRKTAVDKIVAELAAAAKAATDAKAAADKLAADMTASMAKAQELAQAADKAAVEAAAKAKAAAEAKAAADKAMNDAVAQAKAATEAQAAATKAAAEAEAKAKEATTVQAAVAKEVTDATNRAKPAEINMAVPSTVVTIKVTAAPMTLAVAAPPTAQAGATVEVPLTVTRLYGFADVVTIKTKPATDKLFTVADVPLAANVAEGKLAIAIAKETPPGAYAFDVQAIAKFNGQDVSATQRVNLTVEASPAAATAEAAK